MSTNDQDAYPTVTLEQFPVASVYEYGYAEMVRYEKMRRDRAKMDHADHEDPDEIVLKMCVVDVEAQDSNGKLVKKGVRSADPSGFTRAELADLVSRCAMELSAALDEDPEKDEYGICNGGLRCVLIDTTTQPLTVSAWLDY